MNNISVIPPELLTYIFSFCHPADFGRISQVCRNWQRVAEDKAAHRASARRFLGVSVQDNGRPWLHPKFVHWQRVGADAGVSLPPVNLSHEDGYEVKPGVFQGQPVLAGRPASKERRGIILYDSQTLREVAFLADQEFLRRPHGFMQDPTTGRPCVLVAEYADDNPIRPLGSVLWDPQENICLPLSAIPNCFALDCPLLWHGELSILFFRGDERSYDLCVQPLRGGEAITLVSPFRGELVTETPEKDLLIAHDAIKHKQNIFHCWSTQTGELVSTISIPGEVWDVVVLGRGADARLITMEPSCDEDLRRDYQVDHRLPLHVYSLGTGEHLQQLSGVPFVGGLAVATEGEVSYLHAFGVSRDNSIAGGLSHEVRSWQFVEGRATAISTGPIQLEGELRSIYHCRTRQGFEPSHDVSRLWLPTKGGLAPYEPVLRPDDPSSGSDPSESRHGSAPNTPQTVPHASLFRAPSSASQPPSTQTNRSPALIAGLIGALALAALGAFAIRRVLRFSS